LGWWEVFAHKNDYFGGLAKLFEINPDYRCSEREAWDRCGAIFLKHWRPGKLDGDPLCYAWRKYGHGCSAEANRKRRRRETLERNDHAIDVGFELGEVGKQRLVNVRFVPKSGHSSGV
jgi:hypothetical protein